MLISTLPYSASLEGAQKQKKEWVKGFATFGADFTGNSQAQAPAADTFSYSGSTQ